MRDEENVYLERLGNDYAAPLGLEDGLSYSQIIEAFSNLSINLEMEKANVTWIISENLLGDIEKAMPSLLSIANKPRSFIETHDEKVLVEVASKIGHKAIAQLSHDSKDWYARTFVSVKPKNITAEISNETLNIYENRVFVSLIRRLDKYIYLKKKDVEEQKRKQEESQSSKTIESFFGLRDGDEASAWSFSLYKKSLYKREQGFTDEAELKELEILLERIERMSKDLSRIKSSNVFKELIRAKREQSPLHRTNIFLYDRNYKDLWNLWAKLDSDKYIADQSLAERVINTDQSERNYGLYVFLCLLYAFADLGYTELMGSGKLFYDFYEAYTDKPIVLTKNNDTFKIFGHSSENKIGVSYHPNSKGAKEREFFLHLYYHDDFEKMEQGELDSRTKEILNACRVENPGKAKEPIHHFACIAFDAPGSQLGDLLSERLARRLLSFGGSYSEKERPEDLAQWADFKTGFLNIYPQKNLRSNLIKLERFINHIRLERLTLEEVENLKGVCPLCGSVSLKATSSENTDFICHSCHHLISFTTHTECREGKPSGQFLWTKPVRVQFLDELRGQFNTAKQMNSYAFLQFDQFVYGKYAVTDFNIEFDELGHVTSNTICPKCGKPMK